MRRVDLDNQMVETDLLLSELPHLIFMPTNVAHLREDYQRGTLERADLPAAPLDLFRAWIEQAIADKLDEPNAFVLATSDAAGLPNARVVLLKAYDTQGFVFYSNYESQKGEELLARPHAAMVFNWLTHERQVRVRGRVERITAAETEAYFQSRPKGSQVGAWASPQSQVIPDRSVLDAKKAELETTYAKADQLPTPVHWGGYRIVPSELEFWQGRSNRLHDRFRFRKTDAGWSVDRLAP